MPAVGALSSLAGAGARASWGLWGYRLQAGGGVSVGTCPVVSEARHSERLRCCGRSQGLTPRSVCVMWSLAP